MKVKTIIRVSFIGSFTSWSISGFYVKKHCLQKLLNALIARHGDSI